MLLITKISYNDIINYNENVISCLVKNNGNSHINKIIVFTDTLHNHLPELNKIQYIIKKDLNHKLLDYAKKISNQNLIIWSENDQVFSEYHLKKIKLLNNNNYEEESQKYKIFNRNNKDILEKIKREQTEIILRTETNNIVIQQPDKVKKVKKTQSKLIEKLDVIIISVDYNDFLILTLQNNKKIFDNIHVVTSENDFLCQKICKSLNVDCIVTEIMYEDDAKFNKGKAINYAIDKIKPEGFILLLDADIIVKNKIELSNLKSETLYTSGRYLIKDYEKLKIYENENRIQNFPYEHDEGIGFFQLFYNSGERYPEFSKDASWSDLVFRDGFKNKNKTENVVIHLGHTKKNWSGRITNRFLENEELLSILNNIEEYITILYPPTINWNLLFQRPQQLMKSFAKQKNVRSIFWNSNEFSKKKLIRELDENLYIVDQYLNIEEFSHLFKGKKVYWFSHPSHHYLKELLDWDVVIFDAIDNPVDEFAEWSTELKTAVEKSDIIISSAKIMYDEHKKSGKPVYMLPNGSDFELFEKSINKLEKPYDFPDLKGPVVGYYGAMATWIDWEIVEKISTKYQIIMIGGNKYYNEKISSDNIHYLDHKKIEELPNYLSHIDVPIIPFRLTEMIKGCDPIKFYEYISSGKPPVVTQMIELERFKDICYFMNIENCLDIIEEAAIENNKELVNKRIEIAKLNSWNVRAKTAVEIIRKYLNAK